MSEVTVGIIALIVLLGLFLTGIELAFCMSIVGFVGFAYLNSFSAACTSGKGFLRHLYELQLYGYSSFCSHGPGSAKF